MNHESQLIEWRRELHTWPELSGQEFATTARLRGWLAAAGIRILDYPLETGVVAEIGSGETVIALRADIDALPIHEPSGVRFHSRHPGVMHACGHDLHSAVKQAQQVECKNALHPECHDASHGKDCTADRAPNNMRFFIIFLQISALLFRRPT